MKPIRRNLALLAAAASLTAGSVWLLPRAADAHDCVIVGTPTTTIQTAADCVSYLNPSTTTHDCTGSGDGFSLFVCRDSGR